MRTEYLILSKYEKLSLFKSICDFSSEPQKNYVYYKAEEKIIQESSRLINDTVRHNPQLKNFTNHLEVYFTNKRKFLFYVLNNSIEVFENPAMKKEVAQTVQNDYEELLIEYIFSEQDPEFSKKCKKVVHQFLKSHSINPYFFTEEMVTAFSDYFVGFVSITLASRFTPKSHDEQSSFDKNGNFQIKHTSVKYAISRLFEDPKFSHVSYSQNEVNNLIVLSESHKLALATKLIEFLIESDVLVESPTIFVGKNQQRKMLVAGPLLAELMVRLPVKNKNSVRFTPSLWAFDETLDRYNAEHCQAIGAKKTITNPDKNNEESFHYKKEEIAEKHLNLINSAAAVPYVANEKNIVICLNNLKESSDQNLICELSSTKTFYDSFYVKSPNFEKAFNFKNFSTEKKERIAYNRSLAEAQKRILALKTAIWIYQVQCETDLPVYCIFYFDARLRVYNVVWPNGYQTDPFCRCFLSPFLEPNKLDIFGLFNARILSKDPERSLVQYDFHSSAILIYSLSFLDKLARDKVKLFTQQDKKESLHEEMYNLARDRSKKDERYMYLLVFLQFNIQNIKKITMPYFYGAGPDALVKELSKNQSLPSFFNNIVLALKGAPEKVFDNKNEAFSPIVHDLIYLRQNVLMDFHQCSSKTYFLTQLDYFPFDEGQKFTKSFGQFFEKYINVFDIVFSSLGFRNIKKNEWLLKTNLSVLPLSSDYFQIIFDVFVTNTKAFLEIESEGNQVSMFRFVRDALHFALENPILTASCINAGKMQKFPVAFEDRISTPFPKFPRLLNSQVSLNDLRLVAKSLNKEVKQIMKDASATQLIFSRHDYKIKMGTYSYKDRSQIFKKLTAYVIVPLEKAISKIEKAEPGLLQKLIVLFKKHNKEKVDSSMREFSVDSGSVHYYYFNKFLTEPRKNFYNKFFYVIQLIHLITIDINAKRRLKTNTNFKRFINYTYTFLSKNISRVGYLKQYFVKVFYLPKVRQLLQCEPTPVLDSDNISLKTQLTFRNMTEFVRQYKISEETTKDEITADDTENGVQLSQHIVDTWTTYERRFFINNLVSLNVTKIFPKGTKLPERLVYYLLSFICSGYLKPFVVGLQTTAANQLIKIIDDLHPNISKLRKLYPNFADSKLSFREGRIVFEPYNGYAFNRMLELKPPTSEDNHKNNANNYSNLLVRYQNLCCFKDNLESHLQLLRINGVSIEECSKAIEQIDEKLLLLRESLNKKYSCSLSPFFKLSKDNPDYPLSIRIGKDQDPDYIERNFVTFSIASLSSPVQEFLRPVFNFDKESVKFTSQIIHYLDSVVLAEMAWTNKNNAWVQTCHDSFKIHTANLTFFKQQLYKCLFRVFMDSRFPLLRAFDLQKQYKDILYQKIFINFEDKKIKKVEEASDFIETLLNDLENFDLSFTHSFENQVHELTEGLKRERNKILNETIKEAASIYGVENNTPEAIFEPLFTMPLTSSALESYSSIFIQPRTIPIRIIELFYDLLREVFRCNWFNEESQLWVQWHKQYDDFYHIKNLYEENYRKKRNDEAMKQVEALTKIWLETYPKENLFKVYEFLGIDNRFLEQYQLKEEYSLIFRGDKKTKNFVKFLAKADTELQCYFYYFLFVGGLQERILNIQNILTEIDGNIETCLGYQNSNEFLMSEAAKKDFEYNSSNEKVFVRGKTYNLTKFPLNSNLVPREEAFNLGQMLKINKQLILFGHPLSYLKWHTKLKKKALDKTK